MERTHLKAKPAALRLYPRLASKSKSSATTFVERLTLRNRSDVAGGGSPGQPSRTQMRMRLLKMILDNEQARRQEPHAS